MTKGEGLDVCLPGFATSEPERESEIEAAIEQAFSAMVEALPERPLSSPGDDQTDQESRSRLTEALPILLAMDLTPRPEVGHMTNQGGQDSALTWVSDLGEGQGRNTALIGIPPRTDGDAYVGFETEGQLIGLVPGGAPQA